ncbi:hypothetical protein QFZ76_002538 [Streptomyces sp. V4I2]|nr:hypothetical protein [Streptomyces sp. V4I2]
MNLTLPSSEPDPVASCRDCLGIAVTRANARSVGDYSKASDANVDLRVHLREGHGEAGSADADRLTDGELRSTVRAE